MIVPDRFLRAQQVAAPRRQPHQRRDRRARQKRPHRVWKNCQRKSSPTVGKGQECARFQESILSLNIYADKWHSQNN
jgi:hypothetical protein